MNNKEVRFIPFDQWAEMRAEENEEGSAVITGQPIVFNQVTDLGFCREVIEPAALENTDLRDVPLLCQHDFGMIPLARSRNNNANSTMQLTITESGMFIRATLDIKGNPKAAELYSAIRRGDITGMSFAFVVGEDSWEGLDTDSPLRSIRGITKVFEVSAVTHPAYIGTSIQAAGMEEALESAKSSLESARRQLAEERAKEAEQERRTALIARLEKLNGEVKHNEV